MQMETMKRQFVYGALKLPDPDPAMSPDEVKGLYVAAYPELNTAVVEGPEVSGTTAKYTFRKAVGTKG